jgi:2,4-dienoyl-CoA reductase-like NADH-dependent reductase (Old Yellow Enzyme family)
MMVQVHHKGGTRHAPDAPNPYLPSVSPSGVVHRPSEEDPFRVELIGEALTRPQIERLVEAYGAAAETAVKLGFDGLEVHGAHGYLIDQFLWPVTNRRTDAYGGCAANRARFAAEIVAECRRRTGPDFPILFRTSQWKTTLYAAMIAHSPEELEALLSPIAAAGVDLFDCSQRRFWEPVFDGSDLNLAGWVKKVTGKPTMTVGSVTLSGEFVPKAASNSRVTSGSKPAKGLGPQIRAGAESNLDRLVAMLERGEFDLIGVGRALLANWNWPLLIEDGRWRDLVPFEADTLAWSTNFPELAHATMSNHSERGA